MSKRDNTWQFARGIAILAVILIHCPNGIKYDVGSVSFNSWMILRQFINFPVALFIFMAGYFTDPEKVKNYKRYLAVRGVKLLLPYLVWSVIYSAFNILLEVVRHNNFTLQEVATDFILGRSAPQLYYCIVLLQLTVLTPIIIRIVTHKRLKWVLYSITPLWLVFIYICNIRTGEMPPLYNISFPAWIGFYAWGIEERQADVRKMPWWPISMAMVAEIGEAFALLAIGCSPQFACSQIRITPFVLVALLVLRFRDMKRLAVNWVCYIGDRSYGIFFVHYIFILLSRPLVARLPYIFQSWILQTLICAVISLALSVAIINIVQKIVKKTDRLSILGFN